MFGVITKNCKQEVMFVAGRGGGGDGGLQKRAFTLKCLLFFPDRKI